MSVSAEEGNVGHIWTFICPGPPVAHLDFLQYELYSNAACMLNAKDYLGLNAIGTTWGN